MRILQSRQAAELEDPVQSKFAMVAPVLQATLQSLARDRIARLGGLEHVTLRDLAREFREGHGDAGICFEYAVHDAVATGNPLIAPLVSEVLEHFCAVSGGAESILFGPEKEGVIPIVESVRDALTEDSVLLVGNRGRPPKLRRYVDQIVNAYRRNEERSKLPRSMRGVWKADLFLGNASAEQWVATTVKINPRHLEGAKGLRVGVYPKQSKADGPRLDGNLNLVRLPLQYDSAFMELFYKAFNLVRAFLRADAKVPTPVHLPDAEDRFVAQELTNRRQFPVLAAIDAIYALGQRDLLASESVTRLKVDALLSKEEGLKTDASGYTEPDSVALAPITSTEGPATG